MSAARSLRAAVAIAVLLAVRGEARGAPPGSTALRDAMGREVAIRLPVRRIVSLAPSATETLFALGAGDLVTGVSRHCDFPVEARLKPKMGDFNQPDVARVVEAAPDVVLFTEYARPADLEALAGAGIAGLVLTAGSVDDVLSAIRLLGELAGRAEAAERIAAEISATLREIAGRLAQVADADRPSVYVEVDGPEKLYAVGPGSFMDDIVRLAGGRNVFSGKSSPYFPVESAEVIAANPGVILVDYPFAYKVGVARREGWAGIEAVRAGRVFDGTDYDIILFNRPGPRIARALREIARLLHPTIFREP